MGMANSLTAFSPTYWSKKMGHKRYKTNVFRSFASFKEEAVLYDGQTVDRPYRSDVAVENYTKGTALTAQDLTATSDQISISTIKALLMYVDNVDKIQNKYDAADAWIEEAMERLNNSLDAHFFYNIISANDTIDDGDIGGTSGNGITVTTANILNVFGKLNRKFDVNNVPRGDKRRFGISPQFYDVLWQYIAGKESLLGDKSGENGNIGRYAGLELFLTNNLTGSAVWVPANAPTANDTITINGVTFTFVDSIGTTAGNVLVNGGTVAQVITRLTTLINAPGTTTANGVAFAGADLREVQDWVAVDGTTLITVRAKGASYMTVTGSDSNDVWTAAKQIQHLFASYQGAADMVVQKAPSVEMASTVSAGKSGINILPMTLSGTGVFNQGKNEMFDVLVRSDAY